jgi:hypothetical protein
MERDHYSPRLAVKAVHYIASVASTGVELTLRWAKILQGTGLRSPGVELIIRTIRIWPVETEALIYFRSMNSTVAHLR